MSDTFYIGIAGLTIKMTAIFPLAKQLCNDFIAEESDADICVSATMEEIEQDIANSEDVTTPEYAEFICLYRKIAEQLPNFSCFVFHGAAISYEDKGYLFTAQSGTGKSTHIILWRKYLGLAADIINGDKPIIKIADDGVYICSTPWAGKENWKKNRICKLCGIAFLERSKVNFAKSIAPNNTISRVINQIYIPKNSSARVKTFELLDKLLNLTPAIIFGCDISEDAVKTSFEALTGYKYNEKKLND